MTMLEVWQVAADAAGQWLAQPKPTGQEVNRDWRRIEDTPDIRYLPWEGHILIMVSKKI